MHLTYDLNPAKKRGINSGSGLRSLRSVNHAVINKIKFAADEATFKRAVGLYESGKVTEVEEAFGDFTALVLGAKPYRVSVSGRRYNDADCTCYLGQKGTLCKHIVALALYAVTDGQPLSAEDKQQRHQAICSDRREVLNKEELAAVKKSITESMKYIKPFTGPSRTWFANQDSLREGCNRLSAIVSDLPVNKQVAEVLVKLLLRLDKKLCVGGVDDSNGTVGRFMSEVARMLEEYTRIDPACIETFEPLVGKETCFGWEEPLVRILDEA
ncbi:MAG: SWIM zinc finger family protein [Candidatus Omnitrophica bacterium]|nr:SWIM zinc finger family protein [Candidatus Omnitrophota bacterium]